MSLALVKEIRRVRNTVSSRPTTSVPDDPVELARSVGIDPEVWQAKILRSPHKQHIILAARRCGKSTTAAVQALHRALTIPGFTAAFAAPSLDQAQLPYLMCVSMYRALGRPVPAVSERRTSLELANNSSLVAMASVERSKRGWGFDALYVDEAARVDDPSYYGALLPSTARSAGYVMLMSTPFSMQGFFAQTWHDSEADESWVKTKITVEDSEYFRSRPEGLEAIRRSVPDWYYEREYLCEFQEDEASVFSYADVEAALRAGEDLEAITFTEDTW